MMPAIDLQLKNYRCFPDSRPARISIRPGFSAFVGVNNVGKSALLKFFFEFRNLLSLLSAPSGNLIGALHGQAQGSWGLPGTIRDPVEMFTNTNDRNLEIAISAPPSIAGPRITLSLSISRPALQWTATILRGDQKLVGSSLIYDDQSAIVESGTGTRVDLTPIFNGCRELARSLYIGPFRNVINVGGATNYFDIRVGQQFVQAWRQYKTGPSIKQNEAAYRLTRDIERLFQFKDLDINPSPNDDTLQLFVNGRSFALSELGGGVSQFIVVLANVAVQEPAFVLIDEPELNLHPTLQLEFLTTLGSYATQGVIFCTHSVGLARAGADQIYAVRKLQDFESEVTPYESVIRLSEFLGELSFAGYRDLGINKVLLVEGPTDVKAVQQILRLYRKEHDVLLLPLGGNSLINAGCEAQLVELKRISEQIIAVIDSERASAGEPLSANRQGFVDACSRARVRCHVLERRALENYFPDRVVKAVKGEEYSTLGPYQKLKDLARPWSKEENWKLARAMTRQEVDGSDLGPFFASI